MRKRNKNFQVRFLYILVSFFCCIRKICVLYFIYRAGDPPLNERKISGAAAPLSHKKQKDASFLRIFNTQTALTANNKEETVKMQRIRMKNGKRYIDRKTKKRLFVIGMLSIPTVHCHIFLWTLFYVWLLCSDYCVVIIVRFRTDVKFRQD